MRFNDSRFNIYRFNATGAIPKTFTAIQGSSVSLIVGRIYLQLLLATQASAASIARLLSKTISAAQSTIATRVSSSVFQKLFQASQSASASIAPLMRRFIYSSFNSAVEFFMRKTLIESPSQSPIASGYGVRATHVDSVRRATFPESTNRTTIADRD